MNSKLDDSFSSVYIKSFSTISIDYIVVLHALRHAAFWRRPQSGLFVALHGNGNSDWLCTCVHFLIYFTIFSSDPYVTARANLG